MNIELGTTINCNYIISFMIHEKLSTDNVDDAMNFNKYYFCNN